MENLDGSRLLWLKIFFQLVSRSTLTSFKEITFCILIIKIILWILFLLQFYFIYIIYIKRKIEKIRLWSLFLRVI